MRIDALPPRGLSLSPRDTDASLGLEFGFVEISMSIFVAYITVIDTVLQRNPLEGALDRLTACRVVIASGMG